MFIDRILSILRESPTNSGGHPQAYSNAADSAGPVAGFDKKLFPSDMDLLDQGFQTAAETGEDRYNRFSSVYPVMKVSLSNNKGDGPSIDDMVAASKAFVDLQDDQLQKVMKKNLARFMGEAKESKKCPDGKYWCYTDKKCKKIPRGYHLGYRGYLEHDNENGKKNGNGSNGTGNGNGNGNGNGGSNGNGGGNGSGNGGGNGGGGE
jgi:hypothetical protein|tara:strand:- start:246 stop:863 length:618 start_codon:yes stop_codon:yes gene_type:complete